MLYHAPRDYDGSVTAPLRVLLTNGRFPVTLDLARQLKIAGHEVYVVDSMCRHICSHSLAVKKTFGCPRPTEDPAGFVQAVHNIVETYHIDLIIPLHGETFYLAESKDEVILQKLYASNFDVLYRLHNKWEYHNLLDSLDLDQPRSYLCTSNTDVESLDPRRNWALKPILDGDTTVVYHLEAGSKNLPGLNIDATNPHIAQELIRGNRFCTYSVYRNGKCLAFATYSVTASADGTSSVFYRPVDHARIKAYVDKLASKVKVNGQLAVDFIESSARPSGQHRDTRRSSNAGANTTFGRKSDPSDRNHEEMRPEERRLVSIGCSPLASPGIHLWSRSGSLATAITTKAILGNELKAEPGSAFHFAAGKMLGERKKASLTRYLRHVVHLMGVKDVMWSWYDVKPCLIQPFLLASYYKICRKQPGRHLPAFLVSDVVWTPGRFGESKDRGLDGSADFEEEYENTRSGGFSY